MIGYSTLIEVSQLVKLLISGDVVVVDCRFFFDDTKAARKDYEAGHIPTAVYAHLDDDMCGPPLTDNGRHPLPSRTAMAQLFGRLGINEDKQVVAYDNATGYAAARLRWMLRYMGHVRAAVLDGGLPAWLEAGNETVPGVEQNQAQQFLGQPDPAMLVEMSEVDEIELLVDSRAPERYRGEIEPIDPVAGHIPGATNVYFQDNFARDGRFISPSLLKSRFSQLIGDLPAAETTFYCGSGVTACNNLLAMAHAGLGMGRLYVGSWSEWCGDDERPIARGWK